MLKALLVLFLMTGSANAAPESTTGQKTIILINATPYEIIEFNLHDANFRPFSGSISAWTEVTVYVEQKSCVFDLTAATLQGKVFIRTFNVCTGSSTVILRTDRQI